MMCTAPLQDTECSMYTIKPISGPIHIIYTRAHLLMTNKKSNIFVRLAGKGIESWKRDNERLEGHKIKSWKENGDDLLEKLCER